MKLTTKLGFYSIAVTGIVLACGPFTIERAMDEKAFVLKPIESEIFEIFPENDLAWDRNDALNRLPERRKLTLKKDLADLNLAAPELEDDVFDAYEKLRMIMLLVEDPYADRYKMLSKLEIDQDMLKQLPEEFQLYTTAALAYRQKQSETATKLWKQLLALPKDERKYRSTWALWMLAQTEKSEGLKHYAEIQKLVDEGYSDSLDLVDNKQGWIAYFSYRSGQYIDALKIYHQLGSDNKIDSLTASQAINDVLYLAVSSNDKNFLNEAAKDRNISLALSHMLSDRYDVRHYDYEQQLEDNELVEGPVNKELIMDWLNILTAIDERDVSEEISSVATALYNAGFENELADCLKKINKETALKTWILAKISAKEGDLEAAAGHYKKLLPMLKGDPNSVERFGDFSPKFFEKADLHKQRMFYAYSEYAAIELGLKNYAHALDLFLQVDSPDAGYIAESLMSPQELLEYMRGSKIAQNSEWMRELLGRKLARANYLKDARDYLPKDHLARFDAYVKAYNTATNLKLPAAQRAEAYNQAAKLRISENFHLANDARPQLRIYAAGLKFYHPNYQPWEDLSNPKLIPAMTSDEKQRLKKHYRRYSKVQITEYDAAELLYKSAELLPKNNDLAAARLNKACAITAQDPEIADKYYQALVRDHGNTEIGQAADKKRWFLSDDELKMLELLRSTAMQLPSLTEALAAGKSR